MLQDPAYARAQHLPFTPLPINCYITRTVAVPIAELDRRTGPNPRASHAMQGQVTAHGVIFRNSWSQAWGHAAVPWSFMYPSQLDAPQDAQ